MKISSKTDEILKTFFLSLTPLKQIINDYYTICESYFNAVKSLPIDKIESIDMGRKGIHNEGARVIIERLEEGLKPIWKPHVEFLLWSTL